MADDKRTVDVKTAEERKAAIDKAVADSQKRTDERVGKAYEFETPTPTQAENDAAKLAAMGGAPAPEGESSVTTTAQQNRSVEANRSGGYQTRSTEHKKPE